MEDLLKLQVKLEKETIKCFNIKDQHFQPWFGNYEENLLHQRNTEYCNLKQLISKIRSNVVHFKRTLTNTNNTGTQFVEIVKQTLEEIESSILSFKEKQRESYEQLIIEEGVVYQEVLAFERRIDSWYTQDHTHLATPYGKVRGVSAAESVPQAVTTFERFLSQNSGHTGGWDELDHLTFVRLKRKNQGVASFIDAIATEIPTHSSEEILHHDKWYNEYCVLLEGKKEAIKEWKTTRLKTHRKSVECDDNGLSVQKVAKCGLDQKEKEEKLAKLKEWKANKIKQQIENEHKIEQKKRVEQKRQQQMDLTKRTLTKSQLEEYNQRKEQAKQTKNLEEELKLERAKQRSRLANQQIHKFQERDSAAVKEKLSKLSSLEEEEMAREKRLDKLKSSVIVNVNRDPSRLLKPTTGWEERLRAERDHSEYSGSVLHVTRKCVPSWRRGL